ncbi:MAG: hypothetical protein COA84_11805 [Robiginitomaculum sp.]|nr:MAG: hypothetical protein COA84_11805 [Robiginitomaculum sp.]
MERPEWTGGGRARLQCGHGQSFLISLFAIALTFPAFALAQVAPTEKPPVFKEGIVLGEDDLPPLIDLPKFSTQSFADDDFDAARAYAKGNYQLARTLATAQSATSDARAQYLLGTMLRKGQGGPVESANAVNWYQKAAKGGEVFAWLSLAEMAFANQGGLAAIDGRPFLLKAAGKGSTEAKIVLGQVFTSGLGGPLDIDQAKAWYIKAIFDGSVRAKQLLGNLLFGQSEDEEALALYREAATEGDTRSAYQAGIILADPESPLFDQGAAAPLIKQAAMAALPEAMTAWAIFALQEDPPRPAEAARWLRKAAQADDGEGQYLYAIAMAKGDGVMMDRETAYEWAVRAVRHDPKSSDYRALAVALASALPGPVRSRIEEIAKQPLLILSHTASP